jgi:hypothetical protein
MFPVVKSTLSFREISDYWSREIPRSPREVLQFLEGAWWRGQVRGDSAISRLELLKRMFKSMQHRDDLGIVFVAGGDRYKPPEKYLPDGSVLVTVKHEIPLPSSDIDTWNDDACTNAFEALAQTSSFESYPDMALSLAFINLNYDEFISLLTRDGYQKPTFWQPYSPSLPAGIPLENSTSKKNQFKTKSKQGAKPKWDYEEMELFVFQEMDRRGDFSESRNQEEGWKGLNDLYELIKDHFDGLKDGQSPPTSTLKDHVPAMVNMWRAQQRT